jgi:hypothetical protein
MNRFICLIMALCCGVGAAQTAEWPTDGKDKQRSGWQKDEHTLTTSNVKNMTLLWKVKTGNEARALHALMPALIASRVTTASGPKEIVVVSGISDNLYAMDAADGTILWKKHYDYSVPKPESDFPADMPPIMGGKSPATLNFLDPGGSSDTPVIGEAGEDGKRPVYFVDGAGLLHILNLADGSDLKPAVSFVKGKAWAIALDGNVLWMPTIKSVNALRLDDATKEIKPWVSNSGGLWGRRGSAIDSHGIAWSTTGDGVYAPEKQEYANSIVGAELNGSTISLKDYYTPTNWEWLLKRDLDPNNTPTIFFYKGREILAASGKECRLMLLDPSSPGGANHQTPMFRSDLFCNEAVDFQDRGSWGALSS